MQAQFPTAALLGLLPTACGGGSGSPPHPVAQTCTVTVTVKAAPDAIQHSRHVIVTVN